MGMAVTDTIVAGQASSLDLSGLAIGNAITIPIYFYVLQFVAWNNIFKILENCVMKYDFLS